MKAATPAAVAVAVVAVVVEEMDAVVAEATTAALEFPLAAHAETTNKQQPT